FVRDHAHETADVRLATDVQAVLVVLGRRPHPEDTTPDLSRVSLRYAGMSNGNYRQVWLLGTDLKYAFMLKAKLQSANLAYADLTGAYLVGVDLANADLTNANLSGANLSGADLTGANLTGVNLNGANLSGAKGLTAGRATGR